MISNETAEREALVARLTLECAGRDAWPDDHDERLTADIRKAIAFIARTPADGPKPVAWRYRKHGAEKWILVGTDPHLTRVVSWRDEREIEALFAPTGHGDVMAIVRKMRGILDKYADSLPETSNAKRGAVREAAFFAEHAMLDAITHPVPADGPEPVAVKALEWKINTLSWKDTWEADSPIGGYSITESIEPSRDNPVEYCVYLRADYVGFKTSIDAAKAAAQAHFEATIRNIDGGAALNDIAAERLRQIEAEGWTPQHDDGHTNGEMALAAACYAIMARQSDASRSRIHGDRSHDGVPFLVKYWPWTMNWWKPTTRRRDLVKAGALILAEIERLDRLASRTSK